MVPFLLLLSFDEEERIWMRIGTERLQLHLPYFEAISINLFSTSLIEHVKEVNQVRLLSGYISRWTEWGGLLIERCWNARDRRNSSEWQAWVWTWSISLVSQSHRQKETERKFGRAIPRLWALPMTTSSSSSCGQDTSKKIAILSHLLNWTPFWHQGNSNYRKLPLH